jgi:SAM-dependent methyltransferase
MTGIALASKMVDLAALLARGDGADRAFVDAMVRMGWSRTAAAEERAALEELHLAVKAASMRSHTAVRKEIEEGALVGPTLRRRFDAVPPFERDHFVEEVLGIAYPPLDEPVMAPELLAYAPAGYDEIVHAFDVTGLAPGDRFLDLGSGMGKAVMLAELLTGATAWGVECSGPLLQLAADAARDLGLGRVHFRQGDARDVVLDDPDVVFMYLPFTGSVKASVMARLRDALRRRAPGARRRFLCAGPLDTSRHPELVAAAPSRSWLHVYAWR